MSERQFNLVEDPWIKVLDVQNHPQEVSLIEVFQNIGNYRQLAGEMPSQDLTILRFLLAILTTVYSRYDVKGNFYKWVKIGQKTMRPEIDEYAVTNGNAGRDLLDTWQALYQAGGFSAIVIDYLKQYQNRFNFFDPKCPFYQVTKEDYDSLVPADKVIAKGKGTVAIRQLNRTISESKNSHNVFSPKTSQNKDQITLAELVRWLIMYQNFTATTDKTKVDIRRSSDVERKLPPVYKGWLYGVNPVFTKGDNLFETLILNLILDPKRKELTVSNVNQRPEWEINPIDYVRERVYTTTPENISELYTVWSRVIHIEWDGDKPTIFSAGLPKLNNQGAFIEPMTTWKEDRKDHSIIIPSTRVLNSMGKAMWRNFGQYVKIEGKSQYEPGIVTWLHYLKHTKKLPRDFNVRLSTTGLISDGNSSSQLPVTEFTDEFQIKSEVLFDDDTMAKKLWPLRIEETIVTTNKIGTIVEQFVKKVSSLNGIADSASVGSRVAAEFYERLNGSFQDWLAKLTSRDERDEKVAMWETKVKQIANKTVQEFIKRVTFREIRGKKMNDKEINFFTYYRSFQEKITEILRH